MNPKFCTRLLPFFLFTIMFSLLSGCGGGGSSSSNNGTPSTNNSVSSVVSSQGGTISVSDSASPIKGLKMDIPADALSSPTNITVQPTTETIPLPQTVSVSDSIIELLPAGQTFNKPISITIPYTGSTPPTVVTYNSTTKSYSVLPTSSIDTQNKTITVVTNHFTKVARILSNNSYPSLDTGFTIGTDTFKINNSPTVFPTGNCWGFAYFSQWYFANKKASDGNLYGRYATENLVVIDAFATQAVTLVSDNLSMFYSNYLSNHAVTFNNLYNAMLITNKPQVLLVADYANILDIQRHAVLVYSITKLSNGTWQLNINDNRDNSRNYPLIFDGQSFQAWNGCTSSTLSTCQNHNFTWFTFVGDDAVTISPNLQAVYDKYKYNISGNITSNGAGLAGVAVTLGGTGISTTTTDSNGAYSFANLENGTYSITAVKAGYNFAQTSISNVVVSGANVINENFTATSTAPSTFSISGTVTSGGIALAGVTVNTTGGSATTTSTGSYTISSLNNGSYIITPSKAGYSFTPANQSITINGAAVTGNNFTATAIPTYSISGTVTFGGVGIGGVTVSAGGKNANTNSIGNYTIIGLVNGNYTLTPSKSGYTFSSSQLVTVNSVNVTGKNFTVAGAPQFIDKGNGTIYDSLNNLTWLQDANCFGAQTWYNAVALASNLTSGQCGLSDGSRAGKWRLPTLNELQLYVNAGYRYNTLSNCGFINVVGGDYWSSTIENPCYNTQICSNVVYFVNMEFGDNWYGNGTSSSLAMWPVHSGQ